jgi:hypothetical protein
LRVEARAVQPGEYAGIGDSVRCFPKISIKI